MTQRTNRQWLLRTRPEGMITPDLFELAEVPVPAAERWPGTRPNIVSVV